MLRKATGLADTHNITAVQSAVPFFVKPLAGFVTGAVKSKYVEVNLKNHWEFLEQQISTAPNNGQFLCGQELSGADIIMSFPLMAARGRATNFTKELYPNLWAYVDRLEAQDGYKRAVEKIIEIDGEYSPSI